MKRPTAAEGDHGVARKVFAVLHRMHARRVGHVLVDDFGDTAGGVIGREAKSFTDGTLQRFTGEGRGQVDVGCAEGVGVKTAELDVGIGDGGVASAAPVGRRSRFTPCGVWADTDLPERVDRGDGTAAVPAGERPMYDPITGLDTESVVVERSSLESGGTGTGPAVIVEAQTTTVLASHHRAVMQSDGTLLVRRVAS